MGGFAAITTLAKRDDLRGAVAWPIRFCASRTAYESSPEYAANYEAVVRCPLPPLRLEYEGVLHDELTRHMRDWLLPDKAPDLAGKQLCIFAFDRDVVSHGPRCTSPPLWRHMPLSWGWLTVKHFDTDHGYNSRRYAVQRCGRVD
jgi:hypothetical protein